MPVGSAEVSASRTPSTAPQVRVKISMKRVDCVGNTCDAWLSDWSLH